jgi:hypothetical protein
MLTWFPYLVIWQYFLVYVGHVACNLFFCVLIFDASMRNWYILHEYVLLCKSIGQLTHFVVVKKLQNHQRNKSLLSLKPFYTFVLFSGGSNSTWLSHMPILHNALTLESNDGNYVYLSARSHCYFIFLVKDLNTWLSRDKRCNVVNGAKELIANHTRYIMIHWTQL